MNNVKVCLTIILACNVSFPVPHESHAKQFSIARRLEGNGTRKSLNRAWHIYAHLFRLDPQEKYELGMLRTRRMLNLMLVDTP